MPKSKHPDPGVPVISAASVPSSSKRLISPLERVSTEILGTPLTICAVDGMVVPSDSVRTHTARIRPLETEARRSMEFLIGDLSLSSVSGRPMPPRAPRFSQSTSQGPLCVAPVPGWQGSGCLPDRLSRSWWACRPFQRHHVQRPHRSPAPSDHSGGIGRRHARCNSN